MFAVGMTPRLSLSYFLKEFPNVKAGLVMDEMTLRKEERGKDGHPWRTIIFKRTWMPFTSLKGFYIPENCVEM